MRRSEVVELLEAVRAGGSTVESAAEILGRSPVGELAYASVDVHRGLRTGVPEVIYGAGKSAEQILGILRALHAHGQDGLVTRVDDAKAGLIRASVDAAWFPEASVLVARIGAEPTRVGGIAVVSAGTSDAQVAAEAAVIAEALGNNVTRINDVGVAGVHRILNKIDVLRAARVVVVVAGMDGALPGLVAGLVRVPVIAVPTSVGYGASFGGLAALLTMLNACSPGVSVVNIDNGFGAAYQASLINQLGAA